MEKHKKVEQLTQLTISLIRHADHKITEDQRPAFNNALAFLTIPPIENDINKLIRHLIYGQNQLIELDIGSKAFFEDMNEREGITKEDVKEAFKDAPDR